MPCFRWLVLLSVLLLSTAMAAKTPPRIKAQSYILLDADTGAVLAEHNADLRLPPASLTKIMTAYLGFQSIANGALSWSQPIAVSKRAWAQNVIGSKTFLEVNTNISVKDLIYGIIIQSGNDASIALAEGLSGDESAFVALMNEQAQKMGLQNTHFNNSTGIPADDHYSSARDVAIMLQRSILDFPKSYNIYAEKEFTYNNIRQQNRNVLLNRFQGVNGGKTGYTKKAGYCLAVSAVRKGQRLIAVVMKTKSPSVRSQEAAKLLKFGFSNFTIYQAFDSTKSKKIPIFQGNTDYLTARPTAIGSITIERGQTVKSIFTANTWPLLAPIAKNQTLGHIAIYVDDTVVKEIDVVATESVSEAGIAKYWADFIKWKYLGHAHEQSLFSQW